MALADLTTVRDATRAKVQECVSRVPIGTLRTVRYRWKSVCNHKAPPSHLGDETDYTLLRTSEGARIQAEILLDIFKDESLKDRPAKARRQEIVANTSACMAYVNQYWTRYGIELALSFHVPERKPTHPETANSVQVLDIEGRSTSRRFYYQGQPKFLPVPGLTPVRLPGYGIAFEPFRQQEYCNMIAHEIGHRLGLPDEYADPAYCPDRTGVSQETYPFSIMAVPQVGYLDFPGAVDTPLAEFFPRHVEIVLEPFCKETEYGSTELLR